MNIPTMLSTNDSRLNDRRANMLLGASVLTALGLIIFAVLAVPKLTSSANGTRAIEKSTDLSTCRALYRLDVDDAIAKLQTARADLDVSTNEGLEASVRKDGTTLASILPRLAVQRQQVADSSRDVSTAVAVYQKRLAMSRDHPTRFLIGCDRDQSGPAGTGRT